MRPCMFPQVLSLPWGPDNYQINNADMVGKEGCFLNLDLFKLLRSQLLSTAKQNQKNVFNVEAEMNLVPEGENLWEKNMESTKHTEIMVPGVAFYSGGGIGNKSQRYTLQ